MNKNNNKTIIVSGGTRGIGTGIVERFVEEGANVVFCGRSAEQGSEVKDKVRDNDGVAVYCQADVQHPAEIQAVIQTAVDKFGSIDVIVNNAAIQPDASVETVTDEEWKRVLDINFRAYWLFVKYALKEMPEGSSIVNITSNHAHQTMPSHFPYNAVKSGVIGMTRAMAVDLGSAGIRANSISPGWIEVERTKKEIKKTNRDRLESIHPVGRIGQPEDIAGVVSFLVSDDAAFLTGSDIIVDGGRTAVLQDDSLLEDS